MQLSLDTTICQEHCPICPKHVGLSSEFQRPFFGKILSDCPAGREKFRIGSPLFLSTSARVFWRLSDQHAIEPRGRRSRRRRLPIQPPLASASNELAPAQRPPAAFPLPAITSTRDAADCHGCRRGGGPPPAA